jgi:hypothetical protein
VFPEIESPTLVPETIDEEAPLAVAEVSATAADAIMIERVTVSEHFLAVEHVPERRARPRGKSPDLVA